MDQRAQVSTEYLLLLSLGLVVAIVAVGLALQIQNLANVVMTRISSERNETLAMLTQ